MATTTNYGWDTPDDTDLVKDGAAAIRTLGSSVDTTTKALNPSTTLGDIEYRSATANTNTRLPLGTAGQVLKVNSGATAPEWATDATGMTNPMTTTGDVIYSSSGSTPDRLGIGTAGQVLTVAGGVPSWATAASGGMTLISTTTLTGATVTLSSIPGTYKSLYYVIRNHKPASNGNLFMRFNGDSGANRHLTIDTFGQGTATAFDETQMQLAQTASTSADQALIAVTIPDYANSTTWKMANVSTIVAAASPTSSVVKYLVLGAYNQTTAISSLSFFCGSGNFTSGTILLYGVS
jgi:hypothetical protein